MENGMVFVKLEKYEKLVEDNKELTGMVKDFGEERKNLLDELGKKYQIIKNILYDNKDLMYDIKYIKKSDIEDYNCRKVMKRLTLFGIKDETQQINLINYLRDEYRREKGEMENE